LIRIKEGINGLRKKKKMKKCLDVVSPLRRAEGFSWRGFSKFEIFIFLDIQGLDLDPGLDPV
jgi:hypothetical protein